MTQIPIYRAKKINSDEYIEGYLEPSFDGEMNDCWAIRTSTKRNPHFWGQNLYEIDPSTLSIHFPDMLDSQGNKIFASLSEDGRGGDVLNSGYGEVIIAVYEQGMIKFRHEEALPYNNETIYEIEDNDFLSFYEVWQIRDKLESEIMGIKK